MNKFKFGDVVIPKVTLSFVDGTQHEKGEKIIVGEDELDFFNHPVNSQLYELYFSAPDRDPTEREMVNMIADKV